MVTRWTTLEESKNILTPLSDPYVGIVKREYRKLRDVDDIWGHSYGAHGTDSEILFGIPSNSYNGGGSDSSIAARLAAIGETVERYSAAYLPQSNSLLKFGSEIDMENINKETIGRDEWELFAQEQYEDEKFPHEKWEKTTNLWWRKGENVTKGKEIWTPAQLTHLASVEEWEGDTNIGHATSNGLACGITKKEASISGLFETIERDAFMLTWYNKLSLPQIDIESSKRLKNFYNKFVKPTFLELNLVDMSIFSGVPTVLAVVRNRHTNLAPFAIGAASSYSIERACEKAAIEGMYTRTWMKTEQREGNALNTDINLFEEINSFEDHIRLFAGTDFVKEADFLTSNDRKVKVKDINSFDNKDPGILWDELITHLNNKGFEVSVFDLTSPDIQEAGAKVVKTVIPGFKPIDVTYRGRMLGGKRILNHAYELGLSKSAFELNDLNPIPHPFP